MLSLVIPAYSEEASIREVLSEAEGVLKSTGEDYEILVVDDGSGDGTWQRVLEAAAKNRRVHGFRLSRNYGKEFAICAGMEKARGQAVILMDADLQHPPKLMSEMVRLWKEEKYDIIEAVKTNRPPESFFLRWGARIFYRFLGKMTRFDFAGATDYKLLDRKVVDAWKLMGEHVPFFRGMVAWLGFRRCGIPFETPERRSGKSGWSFWSLVRLGVNAATSFTSMPLRVVTGMGVLFFVFSFAVGIQTLYMKFSGRAVSGFATIILLVLITGSIIMFALGIVGEYITKIYEEVKMRPRYVVAETVNGNNSE